MNRDQLWKELVQRNFHCDMAVISGGATGASIALDAAGRGYSVVLLEHFDFGKGTSSRSTKLIHGGVRYLQQGNLVLVRDALRERSRLLQNASHLVHDLEFVLPCRSLWESCYYGTGLRLYDFLAHNRDFGRATRLSKLDVLERVATIQERSLHGGWLYHDGQFDDSRLVINLVQTAVALGAVVLNYAPVVGLAKQANGKLWRVEVRDQESEVDVAITARCVVNAAGPFVDAILRMDDATAGPMLAASQGVHIVLPRRFLPGSSAMIVPKTRDGRVMFMIPWHDHVIVGTTDTPVASATHDPTALPEEIDFLLQTTGECMAVQPTREDILSVFVGIRPLVLSKSGNKTRTPRISRDRVVRVAPSGLVTIAGGKWTTVRKMAEDCVDRAAVVGELPPRSCLTRTQSVHGAGSERSLNPDLSMYGTDGPEIDNLIYQRPGLSRRVHPQLPICEAQVIWAVQREMARTVEDVLARRTRMLFLNARAAIESCSRVAGLMAEELQRDASWQNSQIAKFCEVAKRFIIQA